MTADPSITAPHPEYDVRRFRAIENISYDGKRYAPGMPLPPLTERQAAQLTRSKAIEEVTGAADAGTPAGVSGSEWTRLASSQDTGKAAPAAAAAGTPAASGPKKTEKPKGEAKGKAKSAPAA